MPSKTPVEIADRYSRKRAVVVAVAALAFFLIYVVVRPFFGGEPDAGSHAARTEVMWAINAVLLLVVLATGGGLLNSRQIRALVNDEVSQSHHKTAVVAGYWVAMATAMGLYVLPTFERSTVRDAVYVIVTSSIVVALLTFAYLEYRAHRDA
jgi:MFS family permease